MIVSRPKGIFLSGHTGFKIIVQKTFGRQASEDYALVCVTHGN